MDAALRHSQSYALEDAHVVVIAIFLLWRIYVKTREAEERARELHRYVHAKFDGESVAGA